MNEQELTHFLKENLKVKIWCDYEGCDSAHAQINVNLILGGEEIYSSSDYLSRVN